MTPLRNKKSFLDSICLLKLDLFNTISEANPRQTQGFIKDFLITLLVKKKKKDQPDLLFENLNNHHTNIKYTNETICQKFLDTKIIYEDNQIKAKVHRNERFQDITSRML